MKNQRQLIEILNEFESEKQYFEKLLVNFNKINVPDTNREILYVKNQIKYNESQINLLKWVLDYKDETHNVFSF